MCGHGHALRGVKYLWSTGWQEGAVVIDRRVMPRGVGPLPPHPPGTTMATSTMTTTPGRAAGVCNKRHLENRSSKGHGMTEQAPQ